MFCNLYNLKYQWYITDISRIYQSKMWYIIERIIAWYIVSQTDISVYQKIFVKLTIYRDILLMWTKLAQIDDISPILVYHNISTENPDISWYIKKLICEIDMSWWYFVIYMYHQFSWYISVKRMISNLTSQW